MIAEGLWYCQDRKEPVNLKIDGFISRESTLGNVCIGPNAVSMYVHLVWLLASLPETMPISIHAMSKQGLHGLQI